MPQAFQPFLEAFKHSKNKRGSAVATASTVLTTVNGTSKHSTITVSGTPALTATGASALAAFRSDRATSKPTPTKYWIEVLVNTLDSNSMGFGIDNGTQDYGTVTGEPGIANSNGFTIHLTSGGTIQYWANSGGTGVNLNATGGSVAVGDYIRLERDMGTGSIDVYRVRAGVQTKQGATQTLAAFANEWSWVGMVNLGSMTMNYGQNAAATGSAVTSGFGPYL